MFVSKKKYNALKTELMLSQMELEKKQCTIDGLHKALDYKNSLIQGYINSTVPEGHRLTEEELSTLIAVDLIRLLSEEVDKSPTFSDEEKNALYGLYDLKDGLYEGR